MWSGCQGDDLVGRKGPFPWQIRRERQADTGGVNQSWPGGGYGCRGVYGVGGGGGGSHPVKGPVVVPSNNAKNRSPIDPSDSPIDPSDSPIDPSDSPIDPSDSPIDPSDSPIDPSDSPIDPSDSPIDPSDSPIYRIFFKIC